MKPFDPALLPHLRPARTALAGVLAGGLLGGLLTVAQAFAMGVLVVRVVEDPTGTTWHPAAVWLVAVVAGRALASYVVDLASAKAAGEVAVHLRRRLLDAALHLDATTLSRHRTGELTVLATRGIAATEPYLTRYAPTLVLAAVLPPATIVAIWWQDWVSGLIVVLTLPLIPVFAVLIGLVTRDRADRQWRQLSALSGHFLDVVRGLPTLVAHRRAGAQSTSVRAITARYRKATVETLKVAFLSSAVLELIATISVALVAVAVGLRLAYGTMAFETAMVVLLLAPEAYWPLRRVGAEFHAAAEGTAAFTRVTDLLATREPASGATPAPGALEVRDLGLTYPGRHVPALRAVDATIPARGLTAVTGPSGCGKSTLLAVLLGELRPSTGQVLVGGHDLARVDPEAWHASVAWAPQRPWLTSGTIAQNLRAGRPEASDGDVWAALERVALDEVVAGLPEGLQTRLGEDGAGLSAGQRARLALARVVLADRPWVLLDEPTAHLDSETEAVLLETLTWLATRSGVVVVAHRDAVVAIADHVITLPAAASVDEPVPDTVPATPAPAVASLTPAPDPPWRWGRRTGNWLGSGSVAFGVALTATASWLIARAAQMPPILYLMVAIVGVRLFGLGRPILRYLERLVSHDAALRLLAEHRADVYDRLVPLVPGALGRHRGDVLTSVVDDVDSLVDQQLRVQQPRWTAVIVGVGATAYATWHDPWAGLVVLLVCVVGLLADPVARLGGRRTEREFVQRRAALSANAAETLDGARDLVLWQAADQALDRLDALGRDLAATATRAARPVALARLLPLLAGAAGMVAVAAWAGPDHRAGSAMLALLVMLPIALIDAFTPLADAGALSVRTEAARQRLDDLADRDPVVSDPASPRQLPNPDPALTTHDLAAGFGTAPAFSGVDLRLGPGERLGVVGPSGCGKSTLAAVLLRFIDPCGGHVRLDGVDLRDLALDDVRGTVGLVDDDPHVFSSTLVENVRLARPDATDEEVAAALEAAHLGPWLRALPAGLHTFVGEGHAQISGGERARLAVARALLADAPVLVLDEPTAHLDSATARSVAAELLGEDQRRTTVWITHTEVGLDRVDRVLTLGAGEHDGSGEGRHLQATLES